MGYTGRNGSLLDKRLLTQSWKGLSAPADSISHMASTERTVL